jgi:hypothetical protein
MMMSEKKYGLNKERMASNSIISKKIIISVVMLIGLLLKLRLAPGDQTAIAPGYLQKQWKDGRIISL